MDFVAIDFETANSHRGSPCEVALVKVRDGKRVEEFSSLVFQDKFDSFNISLHGITPEAVRDAPTIEDLWPRLQSFIEGLPLVAHYAAFDTGVLRDSLGLGAFSKPITYFCTVVLARRLLSLPTYGLPWVAHNLGIPFEETHRGLADATAAAEVAIALMTRAKVSSLFDLANQNSISPGVLSNDGWKGSTHKSKSAGHLTDKQRAEILAAIPESELYEDPDFLGREIVFTGTLTSMTRAEAQLLVMKAGGMPKNSVGKSTSILVFGQQDAYALRPGSQVSSKMEKALKLTSDGAELELIDEKTFLQMISSPDSFS
jgi:DNA polymerase-3 subunit epsilon